MIYHYKLLSNQAFVQCALKAKVTKCFVVQCNHRHHDSNLGRAALPEAPSSAQAAAPRRFCKLGFGRSSPAALPGIILTYLSNCKLYFFKLQNGNDDKSASWVLATGLHALQ